ncbi:helix-turn-helix domain-containing protein [Paenarthrobacter nitroguajacolicus]
MAPLNTKATLPVWAVQRVAAVLEAERFRNPPRTNAVEVARRTGLSKSLARRCLKQLTAVSSAQGS